MHAALHIRQTDFGVDGHIEVALAWSLDGRDSHSAVFTQVAGATKYAPAVDAFEHFLALAQASGVLCIADSTFRREIQALSLPDVTVVATPRGRLLDLIVTAMDALDEHRRFAHHRAWRKELARRAALPELVVATDASKATARRGVGVACVSADGGYASKSYPDVETVLAGELLGIALAIKTFPDRRLHILSDSRDALDCLAMTRAKLLDRHSCEVITLVDVVHKRAAKREVRYSWVRSHSGHELNEIADRLAVAARRNQDAGVRASVRDDINRNILGQMNLAARAA